MKRRPPRFPGYLARLLAAHRAGAVPPGVRVVEVRHDAWCALLAGRGPCNCDPEVEVGSDLTRGDS
jgi:hypothetical protein